MQRFIVFLFLSFPYIVHAIDLNTLATNPRWMFLGAYEPRTFGGVKSRVLSKDFFLAPDGATNPLAELTATLSELKKPVSGPPDSHAVCRYPGRAMWLKSVLPEEAQQFPKVPCADFARFSYNGDIESISVIFAAGYLSNPASFFGHPLIKFNVSRARVGTSLLDVSVNYGALTPPNEHPVVYAVKGLFGGYAATFTHRHFYFNTHAYGETELRDLWEYRLSLTPEERDLLVGHLWEMMGRHFIYLFLSDNCASAMSYSLEDLTGTTLMPRVSPVSLPFTLFENLAVARRTDGSPLVTKISVIPSRQTRLTNRFNQLSSAEAKTVKAVVKTGDITSDVKALTPDSRARVVETLFDYYSFRSTSDEKSEYQDIKRKLLAERLRLPSNVENTEPSYALRPPNEGQKPLMTGISAVASRTHGGAAELKFRPAYYDFLSLDNGRPANSSVRVFDVSVYVDKQRAWLNRLDLFSLENMNLSQTGLPGDGGLAWRITTGLDSADLACRDCIVYHIEGGGGTALKLGPHAVYAIVEGRLQSKAADYGYIAVTPQVGGLLRILPSGFWKLRVNGGYRHFIGNYQSPGPIAKVENRFGLSRNWSFSLDYEKNVDDQLRLTYALYW
jgi:hypothetical protein